MGTYQQIGELWKTSSDEMFELNRQRLIQWRTEPVTVRAERPTRLDKARMLGYKAKNGYIIVRQRVDRGGRKRPDIKGGRRSKHARQLKVLKKNYQQVAEERTARKYPNMEVLNSYFTGKDGLHYWYEVILVDKQRPEIRADKRISWIARVENRRRVFRGLTSAARKARGLRNKGRGAERIRPSLRAHHRMK